MNTFRNGEEVTLGVLCRICVALSANIGDIVDVIFDPSDMHNVKGRAHVG